MSSNDNWGIPGDDVRLMKIDQPAANIRYVGRSSSLRGAESDPIWQIRREYKVGNVVTITFANMGSESSSWTDRTTYFPAATPDANAPLDSVAVTGTISGGGGGSGYEVLDQATFSSGTSLGTIAAALDEADNKLKFLRTVNGRLQTNSNSSLRFAGRVTELAVDSTSWTPLPLTPLANRKAINIQNLSGQDIKVNYNNGIAGYVGMTIANGGERSYDMEDGIVIYAKSVSGTVNIYVEELS